MLAVGDRVVYPNQGVCVVAAIEQKVVAGQELTLFSLVRELDGAKVFVPKGKVEAIGIRPIADAREVAQVITFIRSETDKASLDWKVRSRDNSERMARGGILGLAEVVKSLQTLSELRPLPPKERRLYYDARRLLTTEVAHALGALPADAEDTVDLALFPPGKDRPKRTAEDFGVQQDDDLGLDDESIDLDAALAGVDDEKPAASAGAGASRNSGAATKPSTVTNLRPLATPKRTPKAAPPKKPPAKGKSPKKEAASKKKSTATARAAGSTRTAKKAVPARGKTSSAKAKKSKGARR